ncbi:molecular chaperone Hsp33 [Azonexus fungiphilus]|jgi:molecular chaperone Hsp33|uniref:Molecular chaperone Hsp33 n=1 Tax=Azonexus fungiphilus TaxID=146940 RepID=A0A495WIK2_9RHOO|nr:Hsp33 family molecular chaperone HslO [Azonexus fungiphilus]NHC05415.1 Hsp33 family molecular chaperone HslO [Azonexus fungiphilus]RKT60944.1 molecular chaperone Hsp33 [Azonexus fungiphilus]
MSGYVQRFLFEGLDIRGAVVRLDDAWQQMQAGRDYQPTVAQLLGETAAVTALIAAQLKQPGRLTLQLRGNGPIQLLVMDCNEQLQMRGMARSNPVVLPAPVPELLGAHQGGQLLMSLDLPSARQPYQSYVPLVGESIAQIFEHYLEQSEQQPSRLFCTAAPKAAACLFLQKLPDADKLDADGWHRVTQLAATVKPAELLELDAEALLGRLFHEEIAAGGIRVYDPLPVVYHCPEDWEKVRDMIRSLGRADAETIVAEHGEILIRDDICNRDYRFSPADVAALFDGDASQSIH